MRWTLSDAHDEAVVDVGRRGHLAAVVAGQPDREQPAARASAKATSRFRELPLVDMPSGDVAGAGVGDQLAGEHEVEADVVAERGEHGRVVGEAAGRQRPAPTAARANSVGERRRRRSSCRRCRT